MSDFKTRLINVFIGEKSVKEVSNEVLHVLLEAKDVLNTAIKDMDFCVGSDNDYSHSLISDGTVEVHCECEKGYPISVILYERQGVFCKSREELEERILEFASLTKEFNTIIEIRET